MFPFWRRPKPPKPTPPTDAAEGKEIYQAALNAYLNDEEGVSFSESDEYCIILSFKGLESRFAVKRNYGLRNGWYCIDCEIIEREREARVGEFFLAENFEGNNNLASEVLIKAGVEMTPSGDDCLAEMKERLGINKGE